MLLLLEILVCLKKIKKSMKDVTELWDSEQETDKSTEFSSRRAKKLIDLCVELKETLSVFSSTLNDMEKKALNILKETI